ncbi:MAG: hypothetical protein ACREF4_10300, partial [Gammaproteobacteria bacterium]
LHAQGAARVGVGVNYESFKFDTPADVGIESVSLMTLPFAAQYRVSNALAFELLSAWASGSLVRADDTESTLSGPTDTEVRVVLGFGRDLLTITGAALLPTGSESISEDELDVAGLVAADVLPFRISNWGTGGGAGINATIARALGGFAAGLSVGYVVAREFDPLEEEDFTYRPGNQLSVRAAIDRTFGSAGKAALVLSMQRYDSDEIQLPAEDNLFQSGERYEAVGSYAFAAGATGAGIVYLGFMHRNQSEFVGEPAVLSAQDLMYGGAGIEFRRGGTLLRPNAEVRVLRRDDGIDQGYTATAGVEAEIPAGGFTVVPRVRGRFGNILVRDDAESAFKGLDLGFAVRFGTSSP